MDPSLKNKIYRYATKTLGFDDCRFADPNIEHAIDITEDWIKHKLYGDMAYLKKHLAFKKDPQKLLKNVKSAIVVIKNYKNTSRRHLYNQFKIARYAVGKDYHHVIADRLKDLEKYIKKSDSNIQCYWGVDSRPIAERSLAVKSGIGFLGKNAMVIKPGLGSYFFIGIVFTTCQFAPDTPLKRNCGKCRLCIDACPTAAILRNGTIDASKCISYRTIERKSTFSDDEIESSAGWIFGCDICQEVCPYNHGKVPLTNWKDFFPESGVGFDFFDREAKNSSKSINIPRDSTLYRSRNRIRRNLQTAYSFVRSKKR